MRWSVTTGDAVKTAGDLLVVPVRMRGKDVDLAPLTTLMASNRDRKTFERTVRTGGFRGDAETWLALPGTPARADWILLVGLGALDSISLDTMRRVAGTAAKQARSMKAGRAVVVVPDRETVPYDDETVTRCWVEGAEMALTASVNGHDESDQKPRDWKFCAGERVASALRRGVKQGEAYAEGCLRARWLVNLPPNRLTPGQLAAEARRVARMAEMKCTVLGVPELRRLKMGGILGVGQGSRHQPRLAVLESRRARRDAPVVALVGKGVTFDSGGISIKPSAKMDLMKGDMAGAAAVLGAALIISRLEVPVHLIVAVPTAENMPDGNAIKPSDVLEIAGKSVEVLNTDAEGRLILADALHHVCRRKPDFVIDIATLTGACVVALGSHFAGLLGSSADLMEIIEQAGGETFERVWPLPLIDEHLKELKSPVADLKNISGREGGALTAAAFLSSFVPEDVAWAHVDIAGPAWADRAGPLGPKGATGFGARLLARAVEILGG